MEAPYGCEICGEAFASPSLLKEHMTTHAEEFKFNCQFCPAGFTKKDYLIYHERTHSNDRPFECNICGKNFKRKTHLTMHKFVHTGEKHFDCTLCNMKFKSRSRLIAHEIIHTGEKPYQCGFCPQAFANALNLENHQERVHNSIKKYHCKHCEKMFFSVQELEHHTNQHTEAYPYACVECGKRFQKSTTLAIHKKIHPEVKSYECDICGSCFKQKSILKYHKYRHQADMYECKECGRFFNRPLDLRRHLAGMHRPNEILPTEDKPYQCDICKRTFKLKAHLKRHEQAHLNDIDYPCNECQRNFRSEKALKDHRKIHEGRKYECRKCNQKFHLKDNLDAHLLRHITDKPYGCQFCNSSFKQASELKEHLLLHTGDKPYYCLFCPSKFKQKAHLASHVRTSHPDECEDNDEDMSADSTSDSSYSEYDSADTEIYMMDTENDNPASDSETEIDQVSSRSKQSEKTSKSEEKAPITFLFCGRLEGQSGAKKGSKLAGNQSYEKMLNDNVENIILPFRSNVVRECSKKMECKEHFEIWDNGASQTFRPRRNNVILNSSGNPSTIVNCDSSSDMNRAGTIENQRNISSATDTTESSRHHLLDLPKLSNYADTDNLLSWPSPQHINLFEHFDSSFETDLSESFDDLRSMRSRRKIFGISSELHANNIANNNNNTHIASHPNPASSQEQMNTRRENIPDTVITSLAMDLTQNASNDLVEFNYPSDILDELLGNNTGKDDTNGHAKASIGQNAIENEQPKSDSNNSNELSNNTQQIAVPQYTPTSLQPNLSDMSKDERNVEVTSVPQEKAVMGTFKESNQNSNFWPGLTTNTGKFPKANWSALKAGVAEIRETNKNNGGCQNLFQSLTISPKKECLFEKKGKSMRDGDHRWKYTNGSEIEFQKRKREGRFIKADKNISFFVSGNYSTMDECSSVDYDMADNATIDDISCADSDNETIRTGDLADDSLQDTDSAAGSPQMESSCDYYSDDDSIVSELDTISEYDSSVEGENSMTDNCSSASSDDEIKIKIPHQKAHTRECLRKKDLWLKRNFKFKIDKFGSKNCVSYVIQKKNYSDRNKHSIHSNVSEIQNKFGKNTNITEEKIAGIRDMIKKKHIRRTSRSGSVNLRLSESKSIESVNETNYRSDASAARSQNSWKMCDMKLNEGDFESDNVNKFIVENGNCSVLSSSDDVIEPVFKIASPRYKTRYAKLKIAGKTAEKNSLKITLVKSTVNINRIASPRYKTRYAELKLAERLNEAIQDNIVYLGKKTAKETCLNSDGGEKNSRDTTQLNNDSDEKKQDVELSKPLLSADGDLDTQNKKTAKAQLGSNKKTARLSSNKKRSKAKFGSKKKKTKAVLNSTEKNTKARLDSKKKKAKAPLHFNKKTIITRLTLKNLMNNSATTPAGEDLVSEIQTQKVEEFCSGLENQRSEQKDKPKSVISKTPISTKGKGKQKKCKQQRCNQVTKATVNDIKTSILATEISYIPDKLDEELQVKLTTETIEKEASQKRYNESEHSEITQQESICTAQPKKNNPEITDVQSRKEMDLKLETGTKFIEPEQSHENRIVNKTTRKKKSITQENIQVADKTNSVIVSNVEQGKHNVNVTTDDKSSNMTNSIQVETSVMDSFSKSEKQHIETMQPGVKINEEEASKTSLECNNTCMKTFRKSCRNKSKKNGLVVTNSLNGKPLNIGPHSKEDVLDQNVENGSSGKSLTEGQTMRKRKRGRPKKYGLEIENHREVEAGTSNLENKSEKYLIDCKNDRTGKLSKGRKNNTKCTKSKGNSTKKQTQKQDLNDLTVTNKQTQLSHVDSAKLRKQSNPKYNLRKASVSNERTENVELGVGTHLNMEEENIEKLNQPEINDLSTKRKNRDDETEIICPSKRRKTAVKQDDLISCETKNGMNSLNAEAENSVEQIQTKCKSMEMSCSTFYPSLKTGHDKNNFVKSMNSEQIVSNNENNNSNMEKSSSTDNHVNLSGFPDNSLNEFQSFIRNRMQFLQVTDLKGKEKSPQSKTSQTNKDRVKREVLEQTVMEDGSDDSLSNRLVKSAENMSTKLPYESDGYIRSVPNYLVPSYENTRLKCKERENIFRVLVYGESCDKSDEDNLEEDQSQRGRPRKRPKPNESHKRRKGKKRSESADSVLSKGSKRHKISKYQKGKGRSSSVDSVLSKRCKRSKVLKKRKKRHRRSSSADTVLSKRSKCHYIENKKKATKRSSSADRVQSRKYKHSHQNEVSQNYYRTTFINFKSSAGNPKNQTELAKCWENIFEKEVLNQIPYSTKAMPIQGARSVITTKRARSASPINGKSNKFRIPILEKYDIEVGFKFTEETSVESRSLELFKKRFGEDYLIKEDIGKKLKEKLEPFVTSFVKKCQSEKIVLPQKISQHTRSRVFTEVLRNQPIIKLYRVDDK